MNTRLSARSGSRSSLKKNLMPSASVWRMPKGPARLGPSRFDMSACTLRSNQIMNSTDTSSSAKVTHDLEQDDQDLVEADVAGEERVEPRSKRSRLHHPDLGDAARWRR